MIPNKPKPQSYEPVNGNLCGIGLDVIDYFCKMMKEAESLPEAEPNPRNEFIPTGQNMNQRPKGSGPLRFTSLSLINGEMYSFKENPKQYEKIKKPKPGEPRQYRIYNTPGVEGIELPRYDGFNSNLSYKEQKQLFNYLKQKACGCLTKSEFQSYQRLALIALQEESSYQSFVKTRWLTENAKRCQEEAIPDSVIKFISDYWAAKTRVCLALYPTEYRDAKVDTPLVLYNPNQIHTQMEFIGSVAVRGFKPKLSMIPLKKRVELVTDYLDMVRLKPIIPHVPSVLKPVCTKTLPVSADKNLNQMLERNNVDVVISSGSVKTLLCDATKEMWFLPVTIKCVPVHNGKEFVRKNIVIVDKRLPYFEMSPHQMNLQHAKMMAKWALILHSSPQLLEKPEPPVSRNPDGRELKVYDDDGLFSDFRNIDIEELAPPSKYETKYPVKQHQEKQTDKETSSKGPEGSARSKDLKESLKPSCRSATSESLGPESTLSCQPNVTNFRELQKINQCYTWNLFNLHKSKVVNMIKEEQRSLNVLVRCKTDGKMFYYKNKERLVHDAYVSSKVEFQPEFGASKMAASELLREYLDLYLRPNHILVRARSIGHTKEFMMHEMKTLHEIKNHLNDSGSKVELANVFDPLYSVLTKLINMPPGQYLLCHAPHNGVFAKLYSDTAKGSILRLDQFFEKLLKTEINVPPSEIDPHVLTAIHYRHHVPPAVFHPRSKLQSCLFNLNSSDCAGKRKKKKGQLRRKFLKIKNELACKKLEEQTLFDQE